MHRLIKLSLATSMASVAFAVPAVSPAQASDQEIVTTLSDGIRDISAAEARFRSSYSRLLAKPTQKRLTSYRRAARAERKIVLAVRADLIPLGADTPAFDSGRDKVSEGLKVLARALNSTDKNVKIVTRSSAKIRSVTKKNRSRIAFGNKLIENGLKDMNLVQR